MVSNHIEGFYNCFAFGNGVESYRIRDSFEGRTFNEGERVFTTDNEDHLIMHFSDDTSAFDGKKKEALLGKGSVNNQFNAFIMKHLEENGVKMPGFFGYMLWSFIILVPIFILYTYLWF